MHFTPNDLAAIANDNHGRTITIATTGGIVRLDGRAFAPNQARALADHITAAANVADTKTPPPPTDNEVYNLRLINRGSATYDWKGNPADRGGLEFDAALALVEKSWATIEANPGGGFRAQLTYTGKVALKKATITTALEQVMTSEGKL